MVFRRRQTLVDPDLIDFRGGTINGVEIGARNPSRGFFTELFIKARLGVGVRAVATAVVKIANAAASLVGADQVGIDTSILGGSSGVTSLTGVSNILLTANAAYTVALARNYRARDATVQGASAITLQIGFDVDDLTSGATNYAYRGLVSAGANKFNLYMGGTAINYLAANVLVGTLVDGMTAGGSLAIAKDFDHRGTKIGLFGTVPIIQPAVTGNMAATAGPLSFLAALVALGAVTDTTTNTPTNVTGSRGGNAALANLLTALAGLGWITDSTT